MSIRNKLLLYNTIIIVLFAALSVFSLWYTSSHVIKEDIYEKLAQTVGDNVDNLYSSEGIVYVDENFNYYKQGVFLSIYSNSGTFINGVVPEGMDEGYELNKGAIRKITCNKETFYVYDYEVELAGRSSIFLRGVISGTSKQFQMIILITSITALVLVILLVAVSIFFSRHLTKPIISLEKSINGIVKSGDLEKRLKIDTKDLDILKLEDSFNQMLSRLEELFKNEERFTSDVSHELRTPLTVILSESEYCMSEAKTEEDKAASVQVIYRQTKKLIGITNQLLEFSRFANKSKLELKKVNISQLLCDMLKYFDNSKGITLTDALENDVYVLGDETLIERLIQNLLDNAVKYGKDNGKIEISLKKEQAKAVIKVADDGVGMDEATKKHIFDRFYQADSSRSMNKGLGLGLSFVKEIARLHNAEIAVESQKDSGTTFIISFEIHE